MLRLSLISATKEALNDVIVCLMVRSGSKNPYRIHFPKTDHQGQAALSQERLIGQFRDHHEEGLMDYNGSIEMAAQEVTLSLYDVASARSHRYDMLSWPLLTNEEPHWRSREEKVNYLLSCRNDKFRGQECHLMLAPDLTYEVQTI